jgi:hypothetical protein
MDYAKIYEDWDSLPDCKMHLPDESFWGKTLPDGNYGINNVVLSDNYRLHDIVKTQHLSEETAEKLIIHRRWNTKVYFRYDVPENATEKQSLEARKKIFDALQPLGLPGFLFSGVGYTMFEENLPLEKAFEKVSEVLSGVGVEIH